MNEQQLTIQDRPDASRYEARLGEEVAGFVEYRLVGRRRILLHTEVPPVFGGRGIGAALARHIFEEARASGVRVSVRCPFIEAYLKRHPEFVDAVAPEGAPRQRDG